MTDKKLLYEGKAKKIFATDDENLIIHEFKDETTAFNGKKKGRIPSKGVINNAISSTFFHYLNSYNIPNHFLKKISDRETIVRKLDIIPMEVIIRNVAAGEFCERYDVEEGKVLKYPVFEYFMKNDELGDPLISESMVYAFEWATKDEMIEVANMAAKVNAVLKTYLERRGITLVDLKIEFGRYDGRIMLGDEITPDTCRFWDTESGEKMDKDRFRYDLGKVKDSYQEVMTRIVG